MINLDPARQDLMWRCLDFIYNSYFQKNEYNKYKDFNGHIPRYDLEKFISKQHKRWRGKYTTQEFVYVLEQFKVIKQVWRLHVGISYQSIELTKKGLQFLNNWKDISPEYAWTEVKA